MPARGAAATPSATSGQSEYENAGCSGHCAPVASPTAVQCVYAMCGTAALVALWLSLLSACVLSWPPAGNRDNHGELFVRTMQLVGFAGTYSFDAFGKNGVVVMWRTSVFQTLFPGGVPPSTGPFALNRAALLGPVLDEYDRGRHAQVRHHDHWAV